MAQRGTALLTVVLVMALLLPLAAHSVLQGHVDLLLARNLRDQTDALYVAEGAMEQALASVAAGASRQQLLSGPDNRIGTVDDGEFDAGSIFMGEQRRGTSRVERTSADRIEIVSFGQAKNGSQRNMAAILTADPVPLTPATLLLAGSARAVSLDQTQLVVRGDASASVAAIVFASDMGSLRQRAFDLSALQQHILRAHNTTHLSSPTAPARMGDGTVPQLSVVESDLLVTSSSTGAGVLVVGGNLRISGSLQFDGLVIVMGGIDLAAGAEIRMSGALWQASSSEPIVLAGRGTLEYSPSSLAIADAVAPEILPHRWTVLGRYEPS